MELAKIALYGIGSAAIAALFCGTAMRGLHAFQTRKRSVELRQSPDPQKSKSK
jgi:hypothetical protein